MKRIDLFHGLFLLCVILLVPDAVQAAEEAASSGGYLAGYENADPRPTPVSWWSTLAYLVSLFAIFGFVVVMAYFTARFLGGKFAQQTAAGHGGRLLEQLPLGPNRSVCAVEMANRVFLLGVTEHSVTMLAEITDPEEMERLHQNSFGGAAASGLFSQELGALSSLAQRLPDMFRKDSFRR